MSSALELVAYCCQCGQRGTPSSRRPGWCKRCATLAALAAWRGEPPPPRARPVIVPMPVILRPAPPDLAERRSPMLHARRMTQTQLETLRQETARQERYANETPMAAINRLENERQQLWQRGVRSDTDRQRLATISAALSGLWALERQRRAWGRHG